MTQENKVTAKEALFNISDKGNNFILSKWSLILFPGFILLVGIFNLLNFHYHWTDTNSDGLVYVYTLFGEISSNSFNSWIGWVALTLSMIGSYVSMFGTLLVLRFDIRYIAPLIIGYMLSIVDSIMQGLIFSAMSYIFMLSAGIYTWFSWKKEQIVSDINQKSEMTTKWWIIIATLVISYIILAAGIRTGLGFVDQEMFGWGTGQTLELNIIDVICSGVIVGAWYTMLRKEKLAFIGFISTDIIYLVLMIQIGYYSTAASFFVYVFVDTINMTSWIGKDWRIARAENK